jgi:hypothetical protein
LAEEAEEAERVLADIGIGIETRSLAGARQLSKGAGPHGHQVADAMNVHDHRVGTSLS